MPDEIIVERAGVAVRIAARDHEAAQLVRFAFSDFHNACNAHAVTTLEVLGNTHSGFGLARDGAPVFEGKPAASATLLLLAEVIDTLVSRGRDALIMHAAAVCTDRFCVMLPGASGAGKSSLAAWLDARGISSLSDELVFLFPDRSVLAFPRPICLETDSRKYMTSELDIALSENRLLVSDDAVLVKRKTALPDTLPKLDAVIFPTFARNASFDLQPVTRSRALVRLLGSVANGKNFGDRGFAQLSAVVRDAQSHELTFGGFETHGPQILDFLRNSPFSG